MTTSRPSETGINCIASGVRNSEKKNFKQVREMSGPVMPTGILSNSEKKRRFCCKQDLRTLSDSSETRIYASYGFRYVKIGIRIYL